MKTNAHPESGIAYGYIRATHIDSDLFNELCYSHGKDTAYDDALAGHLAQARAVHEAAIEAGEIEPDEGFDEDYERDQFAESYQCDEPTYEGEHEGVKYRTSWLGGAQNLWVFQSPVLTLCRPCSPCVPGAGDLDSVGDYLAYGVPASWLRTDFMQEQCEEQGFEFTEGSFPTFWRKVGDDSINAGPFAFPESCVEDCYRKNRQAKVGMTLDEIKAAVDAGKTVHWANQGYSVVKDKVGQYLIVFKHNDSAVGLTHRDGVTMNGKPAEFFTMGA